MLQKRFIDIPRIEKYFRIDEDGAIWSLRKHKYTKPSFNTAGYLYVNLPVPDEDDPDNSEYARNYAVHRLVATKYIGQCPEDMETSHKDGNKMNNHWTNLEYLTHAKNILKSYREHSRVFPSFPRHPLSDHTKELMADAKKKRVRYSNEGVDTVFASIEDAAQSLNTYRKKIYHCITTGKEYHDKNTRVSGGFLSFVVENQVT